ncbi:MAG: putative transposase [Rubritalea sp.]|jgi:putative transposase
MAKKRLLAPWVGETRRSALYHTVSRTIHQKFLLGDVEKEQFVKLMRRYEAFCGVRVLSFCVMSNHFHILLEVPPCMEESLSDEALLERLSLLYSDDYVALIRLQLDELARSDTEAGNAAHAKLREKFTCRMWDLGRFMQSLKQCFTHWYNARHGCRGTMWEARYKSVLVEDGHAARVMAAYIDLNPIRAAMVKSPEKYRWCSYAEAVAGGKRGTLSRKGLARVLEDRENQGDSDSAYDGWEHYPTPEHYGWRSIAGRYRVILFGDGEEIITDRAGNGENVKRRGFSTEEVEKEVENAGMLGVAEILRCKTRSFVDGGVIGGKSFVQSVVENLKGNYLKADRKSGASKIPQRGGRGKQGQKSKVGKRVGLWSMRRISLE